MACPSHFNLKWVSVLHLLCHLNRPFFVVPQIILFVVTTTMLLMIDDGCTDRRIECDIIRADGTERIHLKGEDIDKVNWHSSFAFLGYSVVLNWRLLYFLNQLFIFNFREREEEGEWTIVEARGDRLECQDKLSHSRSTLSWMGTQSVKGRPTIDWRNTNWKRINKTMEFSMSHTSKSISCRWKGVKQGVEVGLCKWNVRMESSCKHFNLIRMIH